MRGEKKRVLKPKHIGNRSKQRSFIYPKRVVFFYRAESLATQFIYRANDKRPFHYDVILFYAHQMNRMIAMINQRES